MFENSKWINYIIEKEPCIKKYEPSPYIAKTFSVKEKPVKAILNICGYGEAAYYLNGAVIPDSFRPTHPTTPSLTVIYNTYDITELLKKGNNRLGIILSRYRCFPKSANYKLINDKCREVILQLDIEYQDGSVQTVVSDTSFKAFESPVIFTEHLCGEIYDARKEITGWCDPDFDDSDWKNVAEASVPGGEYRTAVCAPITKYDGNDGVEIAPGLFDFGMVTAGHVRVKVTGKSGSRIKLDYSERLMSDGRHVDMAAYLKETKPNPDMYNSAEYILDGTKDKVLEEMFSIHGFQYVEVTGDYDDISLTAVTSHTDMKLASSFECDNDIINGIHTACVNSMLTCCQDFFVDTPKRDAPWTGDQMLSAESIAANFDSYGVLYENMMMCKDAQNEKGGLPANVPAFNGNWAYTRFIGPDWTDGVLFHVPFFAYKYTGNRKIVDDMWDTMNKSLDFFPTLGDGGYLLNKSGTGDWSFVKGGCSLEVAMTAYYRISALMMASLADATDRDSTKYRELAENIKNEFREKYVKNGELNGNHITEYILSASVGFLTEDEEKKAVEKVVEMVKADNMAITFGVHGNRMFFDLLSKYGYQQFIYEVLMNDKVLGYAYQVKEGLKTLPEVFTYETNRVMSHNHHFFSPVDMWFYKWIAGIKINGFGYNDVVIEPSFVDGIGNVKANLHGIKVEYDKNSIKIDSPYAFTLKLKNSVKHLNMGKYEFSLD